MQEYFNLKDRVYIITGGAGLLGIKHAEAILESNGNPILLDLNPIVIEKAEELSKKYNKEVKGIVLDITNESMVKKTIDKIIKDGTKIYGLINNAANNSVMGVNTQKINKNRFEDFSIDTWNKDIDVSLTGAFLMSKYVGNHLSQNKEGVIINISSDLGVIAPDQRIYRKKGETADNQSVKSVTYSVVKHGIIGLTKYLATYWAHRGIRVNSVSPGGVFNENLDKEFLKKLTNLIPLGRMANVDEYKGTIVYLCSDASKYMNGSNVIIDGGRSVW